MTLPATRFEPAAAPITEPRIVHNEEAALSHILRTGVIISVVLVVLGMVLIFWHHPEYLTTSYPLVVKRQPDAMLASRPFGGEAFPRTFTGIIQAVGELKGRGFVLLGLLVLLATPVISVGSAIIAFGLQKERLLAIIAAMVFLVLAASLLLGQGQW